MALCRQLLNAPVPAAQESMDYRDRYEKLTGVSLRLGPACRQGHRVRIKTLLPDPRTPVLADTS